MYVIVGIIAFGIGIYVLYRTYKGISSVTQSRFLAIFIVAGIVTLLAGIGNIIKGNDPASKNECSLNNELRMICNDNSNKYKTWSYIYFGVSTACFIVSLLYRFLVLKKQKSPLEGPSSLPPRRSFREYMSPALNRFKQILPKRSPKITR